MRNIEFRCFNLEEIGGIPFCRTKCPAEVNPISAVRSPWTNGNPRVCTVAGNPTLQKECYFCLGRDIFRKNLRAE